MPRQRSNPWSPKPTKLPSPFKPPPGIKGFPKGLLKPPSGLKGFAGSHSSYPEDRDTELGPADPDTLQIIERALARRAKLGATYWGKEGDASYRTFFPLALGSRDGSHRLYAHQESGDTGTGPRCYRVAALKDTEIVDGEWPPHLIAEASASCMHVEEGVQLAGDA